MTNAMCPFTKSKCDALCELNVSDKGCAIKAFAVSSAECSRAITEVKKALDDVALQLVAVCDAMKKPNEAAQSAKAIPITDSELERFAESVNPLEIANMPMKDTYGLFTRWCRERMLEPCSQTKLTRRVCEVHGFTSNQGFYKPIRTGV